MDTEITSQVFVRSYWNYYVELEDQLLATKRFVDFSDANFKTFSIEYLKLLQATCSEIDVVAKIVAEYYDPQFKSLTNKNIQKWGLVIQTAFPQIGESSVCFNYDRVITPWNNWKYETYQNKDNQTRYRLVDGYETPFWWTAYNKVKHERTSKYKEGQTNYVRANLKNLITAMAALYVLESLFISELKRKGDIYSFEESKLFFFK